ncbi:hypothetical protein AX16_005449 [Volvariella volvacea WC 439]|nr:hypothetical protein AX16_005449 [Volvariella volvacea WC 439]
MTTPQLWSSIHVPYTSETAKDSRSKEAFIQAWQVRLVNIYAWLARSGSLPLSISCHIVNVTEPPLFLSFLPALVDVLLTFKVRWKHVYISIPMTCAPIEPLLNVNPEDIPLLESFGLSNFPNSGWSLPPFPEGILKAPRLQNLLVYPLAEHTPPLPCHQLRSLAVVFDKWDGQDMLQHLPTVFTESYNLVEFSLITGRLASDLPSLAQQLPPASFPRLEKLELRIERTGFGVLPAFHSMPKLKNLKVVLHPAEDLDVSIIANFLGILPQLEAVFLEFNWLPMGIVLGWLRSQTALTALTIKNCLSMANYRRNTRMLIQGLTEGSRADPPILPRLESFTHLDCIIRDHHFKQFLVSRASTAQVSANSTSMPQAGGALSTARATTKGVLAVSTLKRVQIVFRCPKSIDLLSVPELIHARTTSNLHLDIQYPPDHNPKFMAVSGIPVKEKGFLDDTMEVENGPAVCCITAEEDFGDTDEE